MYIHLTLALSLNTQYSNTLKMLRQYNTESKMLLCRHKMTTEGHDFHNSQLSDHCRVCGKYCARDTMYSVSENVTALKAGFGLPVERDRLEVHPQQFCHSCYCSMKRASSAAGPRATRLIYWKVITKCTVKTPKRKGNIESIKHNIYKQQMHVYVYTQLIPF